MKRLTLVALLAVASAYGQTVSANLQQIAPTNVWALTVNWTAASDGTVPPTSIQGLTPTAQILGFRMVSAEITPGTPAPTALYGVQLQDSAKVDLLGGGGNSLSATVASAVGQSIGSPPMYGSMTFLVTGNSVPGAKGQLIAYFTTVQSYFVSGSTGPPGPAGTPGTTLPNASDQLTYLRIQPNTGNLTTYGYAALTYANPADYAFTPFTPSGNLNVGNTTVTFPIVPRGVNGSDTNHYMYVSGGTGAAEACLITGGSGTSGQINGQIILQCANAHSGAFTVGTATAGLAESWNIFPFLRFYPGTYNIYAPVTPPTNASISCGDSNWTFAAGSVTFQYNSTAGNMFNIVNDGFSMSGGCNLLQVGTAVSSVGLKFCGGGCSGSTHNANNWNVDNVIIRDFYNGLFIDGGGGNAEGNNVLVAGSISHNIVAAGGQGHLNDFISQQAGGDGVHYQLPSAPPGGGGLWFSGYQSFANAGWGIQDAAGGVFIGGAQSYLNNDQLGGIYVNGYGSQISNTTIQYEGLAPSGVTWTTNTTAPGIFIDAVGSNALIENILFYQIQGKCLYLAGSDITVVNATLPSCGVGNNATNFSNLAVHMPNTGQLNSIIGSNITGSTSTNQNNLALIGNKMVQNNATMNTLTINAGTDVQIVGNDILQSGAANAVACGAPFITDSGNTIDGTVSGICGHAATGKMLSAPIQFTTSFANLASIPAPVAGELIYISDGNPGQNPCSSGSGPGSLAYRNGSSQWNCVGGAGGGSSFYQTVQVNGTPVTQEPALNLIAGSNVVLSATDTPGSTSNVTITATSGGNLPGQTGSDFGLSVIQHTTASDTLQVNVGNWIFGGNNFIGVNACQFTLNAGTGTGYGDVWLSRSGFVTLQYTNLSGNVVVLSGPTTNCVATGSAAPAFPTDGSKYIGTVPINGAKTWDGGNIQQYAFAAANYFTQCSLPMICTVAGDSVTVSGASTMMQTNTSNSATAASAFDFTLTTGFKVPFITSSTNCSSAASPAVCGSAMAGSVVVAAGATTVVVDTTAVTANSQIDVTFDSSLGTKLGVTCNVAYDQPWPTARTAATSFTITVTNVPVGGTNPVCINYKIFN